MKFRTALLVGVLPLIALILAVTVFAVGIVLERSARRDTAADVDRSARVFQELEGYRASLFQTQGRLMAQEPRLKAIVATEQIDHQTVLGVAIDLKKAIGSDLFLITDGAGRLLADLADPAAEGGSLAENPLVASALRDGEGAGIWTDKGHAYQMQAQRVAFGASVVGVVVLGFELDDRVAATVEKQTAAVVAISLDGEPIALAPRDAGIDRAALASIPRSDEPVEVTIGNVRYLARGADFPGYKGERSIRYIVLRSLDRALAPARSLARILYGVLIAAILVAWAIAAVLSRRLARPLDELVAFTRSIAAGKLEERARLAGPIEVQALGRAMNGMVGELEISRREAAIKERLEEEMKIANKIQTSILPKTLRVGGLELAARMVPASEVGGDYYDVISVEGGCWIGIGDVAGHGLTAGLVMLMIQSVVASLGRWAPTARPRDLLRALNEVLFDNIRHRLSQDEHVTLTLLRYRSDGRFTFAGAHEDIIICRADGTIETLPTPGPWLGAMREIEKVTVDNELTLAPGDLLVLYTDGITEAMDEKREQFGMQRFCAEVARLHKEPVDVIRDQVIETVRKYTKEQVDDVTLLAIRYTGK
jgi:sigma-B regulation protein RsbU (phosphoserine phosphatase)